MTIRAAMRLFVVSLLCFLPSCSQSKAQSTTQPPANRDADLQLVVVLSRHGVRSPLTRQPDLDMYSAVPWPKWDVAPGLLTAHGYQLMRLFGAWDRVKYSGEGLLAPSGCADAAHVTIIADTDQRTRETGMVLSEALLPGCEVAVHSMPDGTSDRLFRPLAAGFAHPDAVLATAAVAGRIGGDPKNLVEAYRPQLAALDRVLSGCGHLPANPGRTSIFDIPSSLKPGAGESLIAVRSPLSTGATLAENLLLEYTQGMSDTDTGW
jgi:4-phytase/acid phosphatase